MIRHPRILDRARLDLAVLVMIHIEGAEAQEGRPPADPEVVAGGDELDAGTRGGDLGATGFVDGPAATALEVRGGVGSDPTEVGAFGEERGGGIGGWVGESASAEEEGEEEG